MPAATEERIRELLKEVYDPEIGINIIDLGLVYGIDVSEKNDVNVRLTLTTPACPLGPLLISQIETIVKGSIPEVNDVDVELVWYPPWDPRTHCSEEAKAELGIW